MQPCANEWTAIVASCREVDFTLAFEYYALVLTPSLLFTLVAAPKLHQLSRAPVLLTSRSKSSRGAQLLYVVKLLAATATLGAGVASLVDSALHARRENIAEIISITFAVVATLIALVDSQLSHFRSLSTFDLPFYLITTILADIVRLRTLHHLDLLRPEHLIGFGARFIWFGAENVEKSRMLRQGKRVSKEETASFVSRLSFAWVVPLIYEGSRSQIGLASLSPLAEDVASPKLFEAGHRQFQFRAADSKRPLAWAILKAFPAALFAPLLPCIICSLAAMARPLLMNRTIIFVQAFSSPDASTRPSVEEGYALVFATLLVGLVFAFSMSLWSLAVNKGSLRIRGFLLEAIYRKSTKVHLEASKQIGSAKIANLTSVDSERLVSRFSTVYTIVNTVILIVIGGFEVYQQLGVAVVGAGAAVALFLGSMPYLTRKSGPLQAAWNVRTDERTRLVASCLRQLRAIKLAALEVPLATKLLASRDQELQAMRAYLNDLTKIVAISNWGGQIQGLATVGVYVLVAHFDPTTPPLTAARLFTTISILSTIGGPMCGLSQSYASIVAAWESLIRIETFLLAREVPELHSLLNLDGEGGTSRDIRLDDASFGVEGKVLLSGLSATVKAGEMTFVIGRVGSGKSTFLQSCLGELDLVGGELILPASRTAYCAQDAWLRSESIRTAITFVSAEFDETWYQCVVRAVALDVDLAVLANGDLTSALNLSGGQRARVALARALYARAERIILDDVFAALDATTSDHIHSALFDKPDGLLCGRTVLLSTHDPSLLHRADHIIMLSEGSIVEQGDYNSLISSAGATASLVAEYAQQRRALVAEAADEAIAEKATEEEDNIGADEGSDKSAGWTPYTVYCAAAGYRRALAYLAVIILVGCSDSVINVYLGAWSNHMEKHPDSSLAPYYAGYLGLELSSLGLKFLMCIVASIMVPCRASKVLYDALTYGVLNAPLSVTEAEGLGKLQNRFSSDINLVDQQLPNSLLNFSVNAVECLAVVGIILFAAPGLLVVLIVVLALLACVQHFYVLTSRQLRRLDLGSKSPLYEILSDTASASGLSTVRAFGGSQDFINLNTSKLDASQRPYYASKVAQRWLACFLNTSSAFVNAALVVVIIVQNSKLSPGLAAIALLYGNTLTDAISMVFSAWTETEVCIVAVERLYETASLPAEEDGAALVDVHDADPSWPAEGELLFKDVSARYRPDLGLALDGVSLLIPAGSRVGICGRSGSGKSTLLAALFRMVELETGVISVDGVSIKDASRSTLRGSMSIVPQDSLLLDASLRENLDLFGLHDDERLWDALEKCSMRVAVEALPQKLESNPSNSFSRGERQLLALARALLEGRRLLVLDEATSSLDAHSDRAVQETLRTAFGSKTTTITVAHRVGTILDADLIVVMDSGKIVERGTPKELLDLPSGWFRRLVKGEEKELGAEVELI